MAPTLLLPAGLIMFVIGGSLGSLVSASANGRGRIAVLSLVMEGVLRMASSRRRHSTNG